MELIRNYGNYMLWNKVFIFIVLSCVLHAGFFSLFFFYNGSIKDSHVEESMLVRIVGSFIPDNAILKKGVSRGIFNHSRLKIISSGKVIPSGEKKNEVILRQAQDDKHNVMVSLSNHDGQLGKLSNETSMSESLTKDNGNPPFAKGGHGGVFSDEDYKDTAIAESVQNTAGGPPSVTSVSQNNASGSKNSAGNYGVDGLNTGDYSGGDQINGTGKALSEGEAPFRIQKELRDIVLSNIMKNIVYPVAARKLGIEGDVNVSFRVSPDGTVNNVSASGKNTDLSVLEKAAVSLIYNSAPFNLPKSKKMGEAVSIQMVISYRLED